MSDIITNLMSWMTTWFNWENEDPVIVITMSRLLLIIWTLGMLAMWSAVLRCFTMSSGQSLTTSNTTSNNHDQAAPTPEETSLEQDLKNHFC